nr:immunoglobulin light chain junction region [Macaca mulatta]
DFYCSSYAGINTWIF